MEEKKKGKLNLSLKNLNFKNLNFKILIPIICAFIIGIIIVIVIITSNSKKQSIFNNAKIAYQGLNDVTNDCSDVMDSVYKAWHYGIYEKSSSKSLSDFCSKTSLSSTEVSAVLKKLGYSTTSKQDYYIRNEEFSKLVDIVILVNTYNGKILHIHANLDFAKETLKSMSKNYSDYEYYPTLKEYYSKASSYYEFVNSPTGSFNQLSSTVNDYENSLRTFKQDLQFIFGD